MTKKMGTKCQGEKSLSVVQVAFICSLRHMVSNPSSENRKKPFMDEKTLP